MRISAAAAGLILLTIVAFVGIDAATAEPGARHDNVELEFNDEEEDREEISTSLKVENIAGASASSNASFAEARSRLGSAADNATREPISADATNNEEQQKEDGEKPEELPEPLELRYARPGKFRRRPYFSPPTRRTSVNRRNVYPDKPLRGSSSSLRPATRRPPDPKRAPTEAECTFFSKTVCLEAADYPMEAIMRSIRNNKDMVAALLTDFDNRDGGLSEDDDIPTSSYKTSYDNRYDKRYENRFETSNEIKRKYEFSPPYENVEEGFTCPSLVQYARPQLARAASGVWKYIINTGEHTQTLRLEKCSTPRTSCSFISENYKSSCMQVYNYHRLLTWDSKLGLHMDIFKVPTCCSCHVHGYTDLFPPHQSDPPVKAQETFPGADFATGDHHLKGSSHINKYVNSLDSAALNLFRDSYGGSSSSSDQDETQLQHSSSSRRPSIARPPRPKRPSSNVPRPFDKLPQQHAPNTRAPGYKGPRPHRPNRPFRRESAVPEVSDYSESPSNITLNRYSQAFEQDTLEQPTIRLQNGGFDDEYQEHTQRRINYDYHPIIDFFKPDAQMLKSDEPMQASASSSILQQQQHQQQIQYHQSQQLQQRPSQLQHADLDSWKPIFKP
ncbi:neurotrophin 1 [Nasonia vitripennis]|uniref:Spaetzle domain-containing protein n=1 Tax=Nasonia vitripennis TaxID=7425 RepID=A0A7M7G829_NASVI|nr:neurotrophin 1 [Nasonia vitripennis]